MGFAIFTSSTIIKPKSLTNLSQNRNLQGPKVKNNQVIGRNIAHLAYVPGVYPSPSSLSLLQTSINLRQKGVGYPTSSSVALCGDYKKSGEVEEDHIPLEGHKSGAVEEDHIALETVLRLYSALTRRDLKDLSDIIGDECRCLSNIVFAFKPIYGKQEALEFFSSLIRKLGSNVEFVVQPILQDGMHVGVAWTLEYNKIHTPLGKGISFHVLQKYQGKVYIRNVEIFMEPLLHLVPMRLMFMRYIMEAVTTTKQYRVFFESKRILYTLLSVLLSAASLYFLRLSLY